MFDALELSRLRRLFSYNPDTGFIYAQKASLGDLGDRFSMLHWNRERAGRRVCRPGLKGYLKVVFKKKAVRAHRLAWFLHYGDWPKWEIDHINGNRSDNRIENLRDVPRAENGKNVRLSPLNTSGHHGVFKRRQSGGWTAHIRVSGFTFRIGTFPSKEKAIAARKAAEAVYGFHPNHGCLPS